MNTFSKFIFNYAPSIFTGLGIAGVGATAYLAYRSAGKIAEEIEDKTEMVIESAGEQPVYSTIEPEGKELAWIYAKHISPVAAVGLFTMYCIFESNHINVNRETMLIGALAGAYEYREEVKKAIGEENEKEIFKAVQKKRAVQDISDMEHPPFDYDDGKAWCYEPITKQFFKASPERLLNAEMNLNKYLNSSNAGIAFNEFLSYLGCKPSKEIDPRFGWWGCDITGTWDWNWSFFTPGGNPWVNIDTELVDFDGHEVTMITYDVQPDINPGMFQEEPEQYEEKPKKGVVIKH